MFITTLRHEFLSLFYQNALMLLSKAEHWRAKQMLFFKKSASLSFQLGMKIFHTTHFKSSCLPQYLIERKLESYNHVKLTPTVSALVTNVYRNVSVNDCCDEIRNKNQTQARTSIRQESKANNHRLAVVESFKA